jgi:hypothetical protein
VPYPSASAESTQGTSRPCIQQEPAALAKEPTTAHSRCAFQMHSATLSSQRALAATCALENVPSLLTSATALILPSRSMNSWPAMCLDGQGGEVVASCTKGVGFAVLGCVAVSSRRSSLGSGTAIRGRNRVTTTSPTNCS